MVREDLDKIEILKLWVHPVNEEITLFFICPNSPKREFLHNILFYERWELIKNKNDAGIVETIGLYLPDFHYVKNLNPTFPIEKIDGYQFILNNEIKFVNTAILNDRDLPRTNLHQKIPFHHL
jgi:hypothetical protein